MRATGCLLHMVILRLPHGPKAPRNARKDLSVTQEMALTYFGVYLLLVFFGSFLADAVMQRDLMHVSGIRGIKCHSSRAKNVSSGLTGF